MMCVYSYENLRRSWRVADIIARALLSMILRNGRITAETARKVLADFQPLICPEDGLPYGEIRATFMADMELAMLHPEAAAVEKQANQLEDIMSMLDYTILLEDQDGP
ncbi:hypothetical protein V2G26_007311 [Clonostachys chloroleuca]